MNKDDLFQAATVKTDEVEIPEFGKDGQPAKITIRAFSSEQANDLADKDAIDEKNHVARWVKESVIGEDGQLMFSDDDIPKIRAMGARGIKRLHDAILKLNGLGGQAAKN